MAGQSTVWNSAYIKSIKDYDTPILNGSASASQTLIPNVTVANTIILFRSANTSLTTGDHANGAATAILASGSSVTCTRGGTSTDLTLSYTVVEFIPGVLVANQPISNTIATGTATNNIVVTAPVISANNCQFIWSGWRTSASSTDKRLMCAGQYVSGTAMTATRGAAIVGVNSIITGRLVEWNRIFVKQRQRGNQQITGTNSSATTALSPAVFPEKCFLTANGCYLTGGADIAGVGSAFMSVKVDSTTQLSGTRGSTTSATTNSMWDLIQFN